MPFCANSIRLRSSFSDSILCILPWYSDKVRSTESSMSLTVALKISFSDDSKNIFRSFDLAMFDRPPAPGNHLLLSLYTDKTLLQSGCVRRCCRVRNKQSAGSRTRVTTAAWPPVRCLCVRLETARDLRETSTAPRRFGVARCCSRINVEVLS